MSIEKESHHLSFPLKDEIPPGELILRDIDLVGVGSLRRGQVEELRKTHQIILQTHPRFIPDSVREIYHLELSQTLAWLGPYQIKVSDHLDLRVEHAILFSQIFPLTTKSLGSMMTRIRDLYLSEMEWSHWLLQSHWRYFVGFLRQKFSHNKELIELAHWEWVQAWLEIQPFTDDLQETGHISINSGLQIVTLTQQNFQLNLEAGVHAFAFCRRKKSRVQRRLDIYEAHLLDLLAEDRKYTCEQVVSLAQLSEELPQSLTEQQWCEKLQTLQEEGFISP